MLRLVVLTYPCERVARILGELVRGGIEVDTVILARPSPLENGRRLMRVLPWRRVAALAVRRVHAALTVPASRNWRCTEFYRQYARQVVTVPALDCTECVEAVRVLQADVGVIGCAGILPSEVFEPFRLGILNIHPALLPDYRGRSPVEWALLEGGQFGVSLHFIDSGVDTGPIVSQKPVPLERGDSVGAIYRKAFDKGTELLVAALRNAERDGSLEATPQPAAATPTRRSLPVRLRNQLERCLAERAAG